MKINGGSLSFQVLQKSEYNIGKTCFQHSCVSSNSHLDIEQIYNYLLFQAILNSFILSKKHSKQNWNNDGSLKNLFSALEQCFQSSVSLLCFSVIMLKSKVAHLILKIFFLFPKKLF